jgi:hypothetical protein
MARHILQACPVWIYTQSNITSILFTWVHYTNTANIIFIYLFKNILQRWPFRIYTYLFFKRSLNNNTRRYKNYIHTHVLLYYTTTILYNYYIIQLLYYTTTILYNYYIMQLLYYTITILC